MTMKEQLGTKSGDSSKRTCQFYSGCSNWQTLWEDESGGQEVCPVCGATAQYEIIVRHQVEGRKLDKAFGRYCDVVGENAESLLLEPRHKFMRFLGGDPVPVGIGRTVTTDDWEMSEGAILKIDLLCSEHWHSILQVYKAKKLL